MRILFVGDVVGRTGRTAVSEYLPGMIRDWALDLVIVNGENAAGGFGITEVIYQELLDELAVRFQTDMKWSQKELIRQIVLSRVYRQSAKAPAVLCSGVNKSR